MKVKFITNYFLFFLICLILIPSFFIFTEVSAQEVPQGVLNVLSTTGDIAGYETPENTSSFLDTTIGLIISIILGFLGVIFLILIIYSGFQWMTAGGNEETISKAKKRLTNATVGLIIVIAGYVIAYFVITQLADITNPGGPQGGS